MFSKNSFITILLSLLILSLSLWSHASPSHKTKTGEDKILVQAQQNYQKSKTLSANFEQIQKNNIFGTTKQSSGEVFIKQPRMFRWETLSSEKSLLISDGSKIWFYTPPFNEKEKGQVLIQNQLDSQSKFAIDLLAGRANLLKSFVIEPHKDGHFNLKPLKSIGNITRIELFIERSTNLVYKIILFTSTDTETEIKLTNVKLGQPLRDSLFKFKPTKDMEVIK